MWIRKCTLEISIKACAPFSHVNSKGQKGQVMVLDIQGAGFNLTDPELSSLQLSLKTADGHQELLFGRGNQGQKGMSVPYCTQQPDVVHAVPAVTFSLDLILIPEENDCPPIELAS